MSSHSTHSEPRRVKLRIRSVNRIGENLAQIIGVNARSGCNDNVCQQTIDRDRCVTAGRKSETHAQRTARGLSETRLLLKYPLRLALNPLISSIGQVLPLLVSVSVIVAVVLNIPTVGPLLLEALLSQDMYLAGAILLIYSFLTIVGTLLSDVLLALIDPRIRMER